MSSTCILCLRCDLHDLSEEMIPNVVSLTHDPPRYMHALFFLGDLVGFTTSRFSFLKAAQFLCPLLARHCRIHWNFQISPCAFEGFSHLPDRWNRCLSTFEHYRALASRLPMLACFFSGFSNLCPHFRPHILRSGSCLIFCQSPLRTTNTPLEFSLSAE